MRASLPGVSGLLSRSRAEWARLGERIRASGLDAPYLARLLRVGERLDDAMRVPMRLWSLRRRTEPAAHAARMLLFGDPVTQAEAVAALDEIGPWLDAGLLVRTPEGVASPFRLGLAFGCLFFADALCAAGDAVMGPSTTTAYACLAGRPVTSVGSLADVGCGAGTIAITLADRASRVVATDVNGRALVLAEANARLNGVHNIELRQGDLFEPMGGERFDRIVSQPPFVGRPPAEGDAPFLFGGPRGDELALRLLGGAGEHLTDGGRAVVLVDWPVVVDDDPLELRIRRAVPDVNMNVLVVASPVRNLEDHCTLHAASAHPTLDAAFTNAALAMRDHLEAMRVRGLRLCVNVLERAPTAPGWTAKASVGHFADAPPGAAAIERMLRGRALLASRCGALQEARLRIPQGTRFDEPNAAPDVPPLWVARLPADRLLLPAAVDANLVAAARRVAAAGSARAAGATSEQELIYLREAIAKGILEVGDETPLEVTRCLTSQ